MAKQPRANPATEFIKGAADILQQLSFSVYTPLARLAGVDAFNAAQDRITDLLDIPSAKYGRDAISFRKMAVEIGNAISDSISTKDYQSKFKKDANGYSFIFFKKPTQGGEISFSTANETFPGSEVWGFEMKLSASDKLTIIWAMMAAAGFNFTPNGESFEATFTPLVVLKDQKSRQKAADAEVVELAVSDLSGITGLMNRVADTANHTHSQPMVNSAFATQLVYKVEVSEFGPDVTVTIHPEIHLSFGQNLAVNYMADTQDKASVDYLVHTWVVDAMDRGVKGAKASKNLPAVDLRITSQKLRAVAEKFQVAKPRVNEYGFCINGKGFPMWVPDKIDATDRFMIEHSNFQPGPDGFLNYEEVAHNWRNKPILVDWFNDVIVYTQANGKLAIERLLGYLPLDKSSEYVWLNTDVNDRSLTTLLRDLGKLVDALVTRDEAQEELAEAFKQPNSYNAGRVTNTMTYYLNQRAYQMRGWLDFKDPDFGHDVNNRPLLKHYFGLDLDEIPDENVRGMCAHINAYLKAASKKRKDITMALMDRLEGIEYFLIMARKFTPQVWDGLMSEAKAERERRRPADRPLSEIDIPNLDAGGNLQGVLPHQAIAISNYAKGANTSLQGVDTGGGKTVLQLADVLMEMERNPNWRPLLMTKPRLVKNTIAEFNFFSKGKINVVSIRRKQLNYIKQTLAVKSADALIKWVKSFPPNTVFICAYTDLSSSTQLYDDLVVPDRVLLHDVGLPQYLHILRIIGFETVKLDESHAIKKMTSKRSRFAFSVLANAKSKTELSGTILNNTAVDLMGQSYGLNPMIYGNNLIGFQDRYNIPGGIIKDPDSAARLNSRLRKFTQQLYISKEDWAFMLPDLHDVPLLAYMTPKQEKFYQDLMNKAYVDLQAKLAQKISGEDEEEDDEEDNEAALLMKIDASLHSAEQFLVAPDMNDQFMASKLNPTGDDLVSPMVRAIDAKLGEIYSNRALDHSKNKSAVFGIHKVASVHFMKHTKFKDICLHYTAGEEEVIRQFKANPDKLILVADSTSLREGENLQLLSNIFDMQATWAPGDFEQLVARMYRPDPKGVFAKDDVTHYWVTPLHNRNDPTIAGCKLARMISKSISNARFKYEGDPRWREIAPVLEGLDLIKMNLQFIFETRSIDLEPYFDAWREFMAWQRKLNQEKRRQVAEDIQNENPTIKVIDANGKILDRALFNKLCMKEVKSTKMLPGSKRVFTPWEEGAVPADVHDMALTILGEDKIEVGEYVMTEYGPGIVMSLPSDNQLWVELYNRRKAKIYRSRVAIPNGEGIKKLNAIISNPSAWANETHQQIIQPFGQVDPDASLAPRGSRRAISVPPPSVPTLNPLPGSLQQPKPKVNLRQLIQKPAPEPEPEEEEEDEALDIDNVLVYTINGMPALALMDAPSGVENLGWLPVAPFTRVTLASWAAADKFLTAMTKRFAITSSKLTLLEEEMDEFKQGRAMRLNKRVTTSQARNFFQSNHRRLAQANDGRERVDPYWVGIDRNVYLAFSQQSHNPKIKVWLKQVASKYPAIVKQVKDVPALHVKVFSTLQEAAADLRELAQHFNVDEGAVREELRAIKDEVQELRGKHAKPVMGNRR